MKKKFVLVCSDCNSHNYTKNKSTNQRLIISKFCPQCNKHTLHKEDK